MERDFSISATKKSVLHNMSWEEKRKKKIKMEDKNPLDSIPAEWLAEFEAAARRPLELRMKYAFIKTYKPVMDDANYRAFDSMEEYRQWCEENLPDWLGYGRL